MSGDQSELQFVSRQVEHGQYMTPRWAANELWDAFFHDATESDLVLEPTCGDGRMLAAVPALVPALGVEIDPDLVVRARERCPIRKVIHGDFLEAELPENFSIAFGNPPFKAAFLDRVLQRFADLCVPGSRAGFIAPAYFMQSPSRVLRWNRLWTISVELLPRTIFTRLSKPLVFAIFTKDPIPHLRGLRLYAEAEAVSGVGEEARRELCERSGTWRGVVDHALRGLGGKAHLGEIYEQVKGSRPSANKWWHEKVRQTLQRHFVSHGAGVWAVA